MFPQQAQMQSGDVLCTHGDVLHRPPATELHLQHSVVWQLLLAGDDEFTSINRQSTNHEGILHEADKSPQNAIHARHTRQHIQRREQTGQIPSRAFETKWYKNLTGGAPNLILDLGP